MRGPVYRQREGATPVRALTAILIVATALVSCGGDDGGSDSSQQVQSACEQAMAQAAEIDPMQDRTPFPDPYPAVRRCKTLSEWIQASEAHPDALAGVDPELLLTNVCGNPEIRSTDLCQEIRSQ